MKIAIIAERINTEYPELFRTVEIVDADSFKKGVIEYLEGSADNIISLQAVANAKLT